MRKPIIAGNWKMHKTIAEALEFVEKIKAEVAGTDVETVICAPFTQLKDIKQAVKDTNIKVGAQNMHYEEKGAFTGEISAAMLKELMVDYVIIGHSERRQYFNETDETVNKKVKKALAYDITPIMCVGESLEEREAEKTKEIVKDQTMKGLEGLTNEQVSSLVIAYEPIWAIGTGKTATSEDAQLVCHLIRETLKELFGPVSEEIRILYGGSVKPDNATELLAQVDIDGALVGGASLKAEDFAKIVKA